uniref:Uncharacterized protein n=1 Tax=Paulinella chromatophora TaxID=39717 RepID=B1X3F9_PAUCH|nr:hypothetical protein PCC_0016 [Paulinella chromatophora]ACB42478.1 hypothetical protein PCC_0016 [Paulinella chromatophora]
MAENFSFDVVSNFDNQELIDTVDQVRREINQKYDLRDSCTTIELTKESIIITTSNEMNIQMVGYMLLQKAIKRNIPLKIFDFPKYCMIEVNRVQQKIKLQKGLSPNTIEKLSKEMQNQLKKITVKIQGEAMKITGKDKDDLRQAINFLKSQDLEVELQFENYQLPTIRTD